VKRVLEFRISGNPEFPCNTCVILPKSRHTELYVATVADAVDLVALSDSALAFEML